MRPSASALCVFAAAAAGATIGCVLQDNADTVSVPPSPALIRDPEWRPYADTSPFNTPVETDARSAGSSDRYRRSLLASNAVLPLVAGDTWRDSGTAFYAAQEGDPLVRIRCLGQPCDVDGDEVQIPKAALPGGSRFSTGRGTFPRRFDAPMAVLQPNGWEYDFYGVRGISEEEIVAGGAGRTPIDGDGLGSDAVLADFGNFAGEIREPELKAGLIDHALAMVVPCSVSSVYPAPPTGVIGNACPPRAEDRAIPAGTRFVLDMSEDSIDSLDIPEWKRTILRALARYGAYVRDTTGALDQWGFEFESPASYTSQGEADPWLRFAVENGADGPHDYDGNGQLEQWLYLDAADGTQVLPWTELRALDPCTVPGSTSPCASSPG